VLCRNSLELRKPADGNWKLDEAKSGSRRDEKLDRGLHSRRHNVKVTTDGTDSGSRFTEWLGKFDGKEYPLAGTHCRFAVVQNHQRTRVGDNQQESVK
jgi:hypothetical protein